MALNKHLNERKNAEKAAQKKEKIMKKQGAKAKGKRVEKTRSF